MTLTVIHKNPICSFNAAWLAPIFDQYLRFEPWDSEKTYDPGTVFYLNLAEFSNRSGYDFCNQLTEQGFRVIVDNLWEVNAGPIPNALTVCADRWFWYNESAWYQYLGYHNYRPKPQYQYRALMPMNRRKPHRDDFVAKVNCNDLLWSYVETGRQLPNDGDMADWSTQRYMNPDWYDHSYISMVVETIVRPGSKYTPVFVTEKTFKPIAFWHPFMVYGNRGTLQALRSWGFETWDHLWDESYDSVVDYQARRDKIIDVLNSIEPSEHSPETQRKLEHNHQLFFDQQRVRTGIINDIINPIIEFANG